MLDEQFYYQENSIDILLKFSTHSEDPADDQDFFDFIHKEQLPTQNSLDLPELDLLDEHNILEQPTPQAQLSEMQEAYLKQEAKMKVLLKRRQETKQKSGLSFKRKISDCTQVSNGPVSKTKHIKKEKQ